MWRRRVFKQGFYEVLGLILLRHRRLQVLNCGYDEAGYPRIKLRPEWEADRLGFQLYHRLARSAPIDGADVFEVGCGRGGGARFLTSHFLPRSYKATDFSHLFILANRLARSSNGLRFRFAHADRLPFAANSFDLGFAVEAVHPLPDKTAFLDEMARVLRPGGRLLMADFFYARDSSPNALSGFRAAVEKSPLKVEIEEDWTAQALAALEADSPRRLAEIARLPSVLRRPAISFAGTRESPLYHQLRDGRAGYVHFALSKHLSGLKTSVATKEHPPFAPC
jgi:SAM-dependent methyltransferase